MLINQRGHSVSLQFILKAWAVCGRSEFAFQRLEALYGLPLRIMLRQEVGANDNAHLPKPEVT